MQIMVWHFWTEISKVQHVQQDYKNSAAPQMFPHYTNQVTENAVKSFGQVSAMLHLF